MNKDDDLGLERPACCGEWISGSGGHRVHDGLCHCPADWWHPDDVFAYCDEHLPAVDRLGEVYLRWETTCAP